MATANKVFAKAGQDNVTSTMCKHQQRFGLDIRFSSLVNNLNNIFSIGHLYWTDNQLISCLRKYSTVVHNFMKPLLLITILFIGHTAFGQYRIDPKVQNEFDSLFKLQPNDIQKKRYIKGFDDGFALLLSFKEDTLNIKDFTPIVLDSSIKIVTIDEDGNELAEPPKDTTKYNQWLSCQATFLHDTLGIGSFFGMFSGVGFSIKIVDDKTIGDFFEYVRRDSIYRYKLTDTKSSEIQVKARTENIVLSNMPKKLGDIFYGKATLVTEPFYRDDDEFKNGYIQKKYVITYLFTCKLTDREEK
jgi:hypothetical protein